MRRRIIPEFDELKHRVLAEVRRKPGKNAREIANAMADGDVNPRKVGYALNLLAKAGHVIHRGKHIYQRSYLFCWYPVYKNAESPPAPRKKPPPPPKLPPVAPVEFNDAEHAEWMAYWRKPRCERLRLQRAGIMI